MRPINARAYQFDQMFAAHPYVELGHKQANVVVTVNRNT
jgi:hypothetical protein